MAMRARICVLKLGCVLTESLAMSPVLPIPSAHQLIRDSPHPYNQRFTKVYTVASGSNMIWGREIRAYSDMVSLHPTTIYTFGKLFYYMIQNMYGAELHRVADIIGANHSTIVLCLNYFLLAGHVLDKFVKKEILTAMSKLPNETVQILKDELHKLEATYVMILAGMSVDEQRDVTNNFELKSKMLTKLIEKFKKCEEDEPENEDVKLSLKFLLDEFERVGMLMSKSEEVKVDNNAVEVCDVHVPVRIVKKDNNDSLDGDFDLVFSGVRLVKRA